MQSQEYTLTNRLMGDPRPDRMAVSTRLQSKIRMRPSPPTIIYVEGNTTKERLRAVLKALSQGFDTSRSVADALGLKPSRSMDCLRKLTKSGLVVFREVRVPAAYRTLTRVYSLTEKGRECLEAVK